MKQLATFFPLGDDLTLRPMKIYCGRPALLSLRPMSFIKFMTKLIHVGGECKQEPKYFLLAPTSVRHILSELSLLPELSSSSLQNLHQPSVPLPIWCSFRSQNDLSIFLLLKNFLLNFFYYSSYLLDLGLLWFP